MALTRLVDGISRFVETVVNKFGRVQKLSPFFRFTLAWNYQETEKGTVVAKGKGMATVIVSSEKYMSKMESYKVKSKLQTFLAERLEGDVGFNWEIKAEGFEREQISHDEISPFWLYRMYAFNNDVRIGQKDLH